MTCAVCEHLNPEGGRFCMNCGASLVDTGAATPVADLQARTPPHLAQKILAGRRDLQGERRTVTVLFADAVNSTPLGERLDPEQTYRIMQGAVARMMDCVHHCEGTITQFRGDGAMALFGAPIAHENAAHRGVAAALAMQRRLEEYGADVLKQYGVDLHFRVGLNTGLVVVGTISDDLSMDYTAMGDTVNLAARMEAAAHPGTVLLAENTYEAVKDYVECEPLGPIQVKGKSEPVPVYRALREKGIRSRLEVSAARGLTPFVGREAIFTRMQQSIADLRQGAGHVLFLSGEAGIGKSRLLLELRRSLPADVAWLEGRCVPFGGSPAQPIVDILRSLFDVSDCAEEQDILGRLDEAAASWSEASQAGLPYLKYLLDVAPGDARVAAIAGQERLAHIAAALGAALREESARRPLIVVVDDVHWIDENSSALLFSILGVVASAPVLLVLSHRPGAPRGLGHIVSILEAESVLPPPLPGTRSFYQHLDLEPVSNEAATSIAASVLGASLPPDLQTVVSEKAEGNPFFVEEFSRSLVESGAVQRSDGSYTLVERPERVRIPDSVEEVVLARLDRLEREPRATVQLASVIGREFPRPLLERVADPQARLAADLAELEALDFIYETEYIPDFAYAFKHAVTNEVAYSTLLLERRKVLHATVAANMETLYADRLANHYEMLAHHYVAAEVWDKALEYLEKAGDKAFAAYANQRAADFYAKAIEVAEHFGDAELRRIGSLSQKRCYADFMLRHHTDGLEDAQRWRAAAARLGDASWEGQSLTNRAMLEHLHQTAEGGVAAGEAALALGNDKELDHVRQGGYTSLILPYYDVHRMDDARLALRSAVEISERIQTTFASVPMSVTAVTALGVGTRAQWSINLANQGGFFLTWTGRFDEALAHFGRFGEDVESHPNVFMKFMYYLGQALALGGKGEYDRAFALLEGVLSRCDRFGEHFFQGRYLNTLGWMYGELQDFDRAIDFNERSLLSARGNSPPGPEVEGNALCNLADCYIALGRLNEAEACLREVAAMVEAKVPKDCFQQWRYTLHHHASFAELWLARGEWERALAGADECLALAEKTESLKYVARARRARGLALLGQGRLAEAGDEIEAAVSTAREVGNPPQLWRTLAALGQLRAAEGRTDAARADYREALSVVDAVGASLGDPSLRRTYLQSQEVQNIRRSSES